MAVILFTFCFYFETQKNVILSTNCHFYLLSIRVGRRQPVLLVVIQCGKKTASSTCCQSGKKTASSTCCHSVWEEDCQFYLLSVGRGEPVLLVVNQSLQSQHQLSGDAQHLLGVVVFSHLCQQATHATSGQAMSVSLHTKQLMHTHTHTNSVCLCFF